MYGKTIRKDNGYDADSYTYYPVAVIGAGESGIAMVRIGGAGFFLFGGVSREELLLSISHFKTFSLETGPRSNNSKFPSEEVIANSPLTNRVVA
jgi:hypothetical protein